MPFKSINRKSKSYQYEYLFFLIFYMAFSSFIFSISRDLTFSIIATIALTGLLYAFIVTEIVTRRDFGYFGYQLICIPILIAFMYLQYHLLEFAT